MFTTFVGWNASPRASRTPPGAMQSSKSDIQESSRSSMTTPSPQSPHLRQPQRRRRRSQVARACERCRIHRIKCDSHQPCDNCAKKGQQCTNTGSYTSDKPPTLPQAYREAESLKKKVKELELELQKAREHGEANRILAAQMSSHPSGNGLATGNGAANQIERNSAMVWKGIYVTSGRSAHATWFGPSSLFYFIGRLDAYVDDFVQQRPHRGSIVASAASKLLDAATLAVTVEDDRAGELQSEDFDLTPTQEAYFLNLFWHSYHTIYPILDENEFKEHYQSLWTPGVLRRRSSALVDIVLALCIQYGVALLPSSERDFAGSGAMSDGYRHYRRCQMLLAGESDNPTISTLQCQVLSAVYFCCGSRTNMADGACGLAVRTSYMLGLHLDPPESMPRPAREMRRRMWWTLYVLESKMAMKLGRPFLLPRDVDVMCRLPADDHDLAALSSFNFTPLTGDCTWLTWTLYNTKLVLAGRAAHTAMYSHDPRCSGSVASRGESLAKNGSQNLPTVWGDPLTVESYAQALAPYMRALEAWAESVPDALTIKCKDGTSLLSIDMSSPADALPDLQIERFAPPWLQRQRLLLQLMYHNLYVNICRPFISFEASTHSSPVADGMAIRCANHAILLTQLMHQALCSSPSSPSILAGWHEAFQWQWNAAITLIGYVRAVPSTKSVATLNAARAAIDLATAVLTTFGETLDVAVTVTEVVRDLAASVDPAAFGQYYGSSHGSEFRALTDVRSKLSSDADQFESESDRSAAAMIGRITGRSSLGTSGSDVFTAGSSDSGQLDLFPPDADLEYTTAALQDDLDPSLDFMLGPGQLMMEDEIWSLISSLGNDAQHSDGAQLQSERL